MRGNGFTKVPHQLWDDRRLKYSHQAAWTYLSSHTEAWVVKRHVACRTLKMSEPIFGKVLDELEEWGYLTVREKARNRFGKIIGIKIKTALPILKPNLKNVDLDAVCDQPFDPFTGEVFEP
jgi:hypothetical protein